ncbi:MAG: hypothetical protein RJQ07_08405 [Pseudomonadales bacterium]
MNTSRLVLWLCLLNPGLSIYAAEDAESGVTAGTTADELAQGELLVKAHCSACHSLRLVTAQRGDARYWTDTIRWMQRTQNLWQIPAQQEQQIIAYLSQTYAEEQWGRRPQLPLSLREARHWPDR